MNVHPRITEHSINIASLSHKPPPQGRHTAPLRGETNSQAWVVGSRADSKPSPQPCRLLSQVQLLLTLYSLMFFWKCFRSACLEAPSPDTLRNLSAEQ